MYPKGACYVAMFLWLCYVLTVDDFKRPVFGCAVTLRGGMLCGFHSKIGEPAVAWSCNKMPHGLGRLDGGLGRCFT